MNTFNPYEPISGTHPYISNLQFSRKATKELIHILSDIMSKYMTPGFSEDRTSGV